MCILTKCFLSNIKSNFNTIGEMFADFILHSVVTPEEKSQPICLCLEDFTGATISASCDLLEIDEFRRMVKECTKVSYLLIIQFHGP